MRRAALLVLASVALTASASARPACERYRAELASLDRSAAAASGLAVAAHRQRQETARLEGYYRAIGCAGGYSFFGPPPECAGLAQRIRAMDATSAGLSRGLDPEAAILQRRRLRAAIARDCEAPREVKAERDPADSKETPRTTGGPRLVCVRTCDGYFFPLQNGGSSHGPADQCRALCPNAETIVFHAPSDGTIEKAVSDTGKPYAKLANSSRYLKTFDATCSCKKEGQSWAQALQNAERLLAHRSGDVVVSAKLAEELSRPRVALARLRATRKALPSSSQDLASRATTPFDPDATGTVKPDADSETPEAAASSGRGTRDHPRVIAASR